ARARALRALLSLPPAFLGFAGGRRMPSTIAVVLAVAAVGMCILPLAQARSLAKARGVSLTTGRYLKAPIDTTGRDQPNQTVNPATVNGTPLGVEVYLRRR